MADRPEPINAILYAQYHLKGGLKNTLIGVLVAVLVVGGLCTMLLSNEHRDVVEAAKSAAMFILAIQWLLLGVYGTTRVNAAVRGDLTGGIIESHRLTPTPPLSAAIGYVFGGGIQALALAVPLLVIGGIMCFIGQMSTAYWLTANAMALSSALVVWTLIALLGFVANSAAAMPVLGFVSFAMVQVAIIVPAMTVLGSPLIGLMTSGPTINQSLSASYLFTLVCDALFGGLLMLAVARKYRNNDSPAFNVSLGLVLLGLWTAVTIIGIAQADLFLPHQRYGPNVSHPDQLIAGLASTLLIAVVPLLPIARQHVRALRAPIGRHMPATLLVIMCVLIASSPALLPIFDPPKRFEFRQLATLVVAAALLSDLFLLMAFQLLGGRVRLLWILAFVIILNAVPPLVQAVAEANDTMSYVGHQYDYIGGFGPFNALVLLWNERGLEDAARPGLVGQAAVVLLPAALYLTRRRTLPRPARGFPIELTAEPPLPQNGELPRV